MLAFSCFLLFLSLCAVAGLVTEDTRILVGGYAPWSNWFTNVFGCLGVVFSLMSLVGVSDNHQQWVKYFAYFALIRVFVRIFVFWSDYEMLSGCEKFGLSSVTSRYNPAMEMVVLHGRCDQTRLYYDIISTVDILISLYGVWNTFFWCSIMESGPRYHISLDDSKPLRIYTGYSTIGHPEAPPIHVVPPSSPPQNNNKMPTGETTAAVFGMQQGAYSPHHLAPPTQPGFPTGMTYASP